jgi:hypothetical protein
MLKGIVRAKVEESKDVKLNLEGSIKKDFPHRTCE